MDPNAALRMIDEADRVDAETREVMRGLHQWLSRGGFQPDWEEYPKGTRRYRTAYGGGSRSSRRHATRSNDSVVKLKDKDRGHVWLTVRDNRVVGAMGSEPKRYVGLSLKDARHLARYGGSGQTKATSSRARRKISRGVSRSHATARAFAPDVTMPGMGTITHGGIEIGDIVKRADRDDKNRYVVTDIRAPWIYTRRISGSGTPGIITFPSARMLRKVG